MGLPPALNGTLLDGELTIDKENGKDVTSYMIFDALSMKGVFIGNLSLTDRLRVSLGSFVVPVCRSKELSEAENRPFRVGLKPMFKKKHAAFVLDKVGNVLLYLSVSMECSHLGLKHIHITST